MVVVVVVFVFVVVVVLLLLLLLFVLSEVERRVRDGMYTERHNDMYNGSVPLNKRKTKVVIVKMIELWL